MKKLCRTIAVIGIFSLPMSTFGSVVYEFTDITFTTPGTYRMQGLIEITQEAFQRGSVNSDEDVVSFFFVANNANPVDSVRFADTFVGNFDFDIIDNGNLLADLEDETPIDLPDIFAFTVSESISMEGNPSGEWIADFRSDNEGAGCFVDPWCGATGVWKRVTPVNEPNALLLVGLALGFITTRRRVNSTVCSPI